jgi:hypothetical protein
VLNPPHPTLQVTNALVKHIDCDAHGVSDSLVRFEAVGETGSAQTIRRGVRRGFGTLRVDACASIPVTTVVYPARLHAGRNVAAARALIIR